MRYLAELWMRPSRIERLTVNAEQLYNPSVNQGT
jgi:hypothetical protein